ncbi:3-alpha,7-alpha,12-alpha-trihydroxy-5-beta-cholest-24-enoyl-CoA hydratase [Bordetella petrii]|nr:3-alpha,7-alpha,12-alpha-trihydroxy-5-beta-cholest-24-enoyl-CoA hydratase [Bordetella petrii]
MNLQNVKTFSIPDGAQSYSRRDSMLYSLGLGYGMDPLDPAQLPYVYEKDQKAVPSLCLALAYPGLWLREPSLGIDWSNIFNGEVRFDIHAPIPPEGSVTSKSRIVAVQDKGKDKGATIHSERMLFDAAGGPLATIAQTVVLRGDGGQGGFGEAPPVAPVVPERKPDRVARIETARNAALVYRLSGDYHPLHADPGTARAMGLKEPILHGFCSFGMACRAAIDALCAGDPGRIKSMSGRFVSPVYPGDVLQFEFFRRDSGIQWRARVPAREIIVIDRGQVEIK